MPVLTERRKFVRYMLPYGMLYVFDHYSARVGYVRDLGMGGLSCVFNHENKIENISDVIDIFAYDQDNFYLSSVFCIKTFLLPLGGSRSFNRHLHTTRCGQHFVSLKPQQKSRWQVLIVKFSKFSDLFAPVYDPFT
jgi:hypothetical protein